MSAGTLQIGSGADTGSIIGDITNNAALIVDRTGSLTYASVISGTGTLTKQGAGTLIVTGANSYTGLTSVNDGILQIGAGGTRGAIVSDIAILVCWHSNV